MIHKRNLIHAIELALDDTPVIVLNGARQVGKSTLCKQLLEEGVLKAQLVTLDDPTTLLAAQSDALGFLEGLNKHLIIDEVQRAPELLLSIKKLIDEDRKERRIILTGSTDVMSLPKIADSLAGRIEIHNLWPFSQDEIVGQKSNFIDALVSEKGTFAVRKMPWDEIIQMIVDGGYPEVLNRKNPSRKSKWFESYIVSVLQKDIRDLANIEGLVQIPNVLHLIAARVGSTINLSDVSRLSGVKNTTLQRYMALLEYVFLIVKIPAWTPNVEGQFVKSPKVFLNDTGLLCHLRGEGVNSLIQNRSNAGAFFENFVVLDIIKQLSWSETQLKPYHFSIHKGAEVDLVLEDRRKQLYGIEIKAASSLKEQDFKGLKQLAKLAGDKFKKGIILYTGDQVLSGFGGENLHAVPIAALWETRVFK
ncbi:MAG: putative AAA+ superfamily ATPase [Cyclobacteriaceae bacterium]